MKNTGKDFFLHLAHYNKRANAELYNAVSVLTDKARKRRDTTWFGSIHGLLNHILVGDFYWLQRFRPIFSESRVLADDRLSPPELSWKGALREDFQELRREREFIDEQIIRWFQECPEDRYEATFEYSDSAGKPRSASAARAFQFLFVHQIHHRGQLAQALDSLGIPNNVADNGPFLESEE